MKNLSRPQYYRIKRILEMIRGPSAAGRYPSASDFAKELEVSWRTAIRDLDYLRDEEGAPIEYDASMKGYYLADVTWTLRPVELNRNEVFAFSIARKLLDRFRGTALELDMKSVLDKIAGSLEGKITLDIESLTDRFTVLTDDYVPVEPKTWKAVAELLNRQEEAEMTYEKFNGEVKQYRVEPYHLLSYHGNWYVLCGRDGRSSFVRRTSADREEPATFAVSRIQWITGTGRHFSLPKNFDAGKYVEKLFGISGGEQLLDVRLLFSKSVSGYIRERIWHPTQKVIRRRGGRIELRLRSAGWKELVRWILSWQPDVRVLAPKDFRERIVLKMKAGLRTQRSRGG